MTKASGDIATIQAALDSYYAQNQAYPSGSQGTGLQALLTSAGISSYEVSAGAPPTGVTPSYDYVCANTAGPYSLFTITSVNGNYMEGSGTTGVSSPASLVHATY
jgi:type II secretory pathway pseudopilin PulG